MAANTKTCRVCGQIIAFVEEDICDMCSGPDKKLQKEINAALTGLRSRASFLLDHTTSSHMRYILNQIVTLDSEDMNG